MILFGCNHDSILSDSLINMRRNINYRLFIKGVVIIFIIHIIDAVLSDTSAIMSTRAKHAFFIKQKIFGLNHKHKIGLNFKVPQYMIDLYKQFNTRIRLEKDKKQIKTKSPYVGNIIRSYYADVQIEEMQYMPKLNILQQRSSNIKLNVTHIPENEIFNGAEIRFFYDSNHIKKNNTVETTDIFHGINNLQLLDIIYIFHSLKTGKKILIDHKIMRSKSSKWISIDVSKIIKIQNSDQILKLKITLKTIILRKKDLKLPRIKKNITKKNIKNSVLNEVKIHQPFLVTYSDNIVVVSKKKLKRYKRNRNSISYHHSKRCNLHPMYVHFVDFNWHDWIIAPNGYEAKFCQGNCPSFMSEYFNATNHAHVQSMLNSKNKKIVPPPCCVPVEYDELPLLYIDEDGIVVLKGYANMIVKACGCR